MTVSQLIEQLKLVPQDLSVIFNDGEEDTEINKVEISNNYYSGNVVSLGYK